MKKHNKTWIKIIILFIVMGICGIVGPITVEASGETKIHFISLNSTTDAILLESNGHYGMVDSGEDWDYPDSEEYPLREGVTKGIGYEQQVIHYLKQLGVEKLDFYIATHSHSDHIGSGDEILNYFPTERLYINEYKDEYMYDAHGDDPNDPYYIEDAKENRLWDNQYVYDCLIKAAKENGTQIITDLDFPENEQYRSFTFGDMQIDIMNYERERDEQGNVIPVSSENNNCLVVKISAYGKVALLTSDMEPLDGDTAKVANQLIEEIGDKSEQNTEEIELENSYDNVEYETGDSVICIPQDRSVEANTLTQQDSEVIDESEINKGKTISLDLMKMVHHSVDYNNTTYFLTSLNPKTVVITGFEAWFSTRERDCLPNTEVFATASDSAAVVSTFNEKGITTKYIKINPEWMEIEGKLYYFGSNGRTFTDSGNHTIDGKNYCFDEKGAVETISRWVLTSDGWKFWKKEGFYAESEWIEVDRESYYLDENACMVTGWKIIGNKYYYFDESGKVLKNQWIKGDFVDENGEWVPQYSTAQWKMSNGRWWYLHGDGNFSYDKWETIDGEKYYFDEDGWMITGWKKIDDNWYYFSTNGVMVTDEWIGDYYLDGSGIWQEDYKVDRWIICTNGWWYCHADGSYTISDWEIIDGKKYYFDKDGWMVIGWNLIENNWYYFQNNGELTVDTWIGEYYVDSDGIWDETCRKDKWILSGNQWWYCHGDGSYTVSDWEYIDGYWYYFDEDGWMTTGWQLVKNDWYYMDVSGKMVTNMWIGNYYLKQNGIMAKNEWVDGGQYYVDENGVWVQ